MAAVNTLSNVSFWILLGIVCALVIGPAGELTSTLIIFILIIQMTLSMYDLPFSRESLKENKKAIMFSIIACFGVSTIVTLAVGSLFITDYPDLWKGWVMLAAVPCAVSAVTMSFFVKGNTTMCVLSMAVIYIIALVFTPLATRILIGESVSWIRIFSYVVLFVAIPMIASVPMKKVKINRLTRIILINVMIFFMIVLSLGQNREYIFSQPEIVILVAAACFVRIFVVSLIVLHFLKKKGSDRGNSMVYISMAVWKNSGLGITLCFVMFGSATEAVVPCAISLLIELLWFAVISNYIKKAWPSAEGTSFPING